MQDVDAASLGNAIARLRAKRGFASSHALAKAADVTPSYLKKIERGDGRRPGVAYLAKIARALDMTVDDLFEEALSSFSSSVPPSVLSAIYGRLAPPGQRALIRVGDVLRELQETYEAEDEVDPLGRHAAALDIEAQREPEGF